MRDAHLLSRAGCFGIVLEKIPAALAARVTGEVPVPTIGIGAGGGCDGQVLRHPRHARHQQGLRPAPAPLRRPAHGHDRRRDAVRRRRQVGQLPQYAGAVLIRTHAGGPDFAIGARLYAMPLRQPILVTNPSEERHALF